jgi:hypothetical protein
VFCSGGQQCRYEVCLVSWWQIGVRGSTVPAVSVHSPANPSAGCPDLVRAYIQNESGRLLIDRDQGSMLLARGLSLLVFRIIDRLRHSHTKWTYWKLSGGGKSNEFSKENGLEEWFVIFGMLIYVAYNTGHTSETLPLLNGTFINFCTAWHTICPL